MGAAHGLRLTAGAGGEDEHQQVVGRRGNRLRSGSGVCGDQLRPFRTAEVEDGHVDIAQQRAIVRLGENEAAVGRVYVPGERRPPSRRVEPDEDGAAQCGATEQERELGTVVGEQADVRGPAAGTVVPQQVLQHRTAHGRGTHDLGPGPRRVAEAQPGPRVVRVCGQQVGDGRDLAHARTSPSRFRWAVAPPKANSPRFAATK